MYPSSHSVPGTAHQTFPPRARPEGEVRRGRSLRAALYGAWLQSLVPLAHNGRNYAFHCRRANAQSLCQVSCSHTFWIWHPLNLSCVLYDDQINGLTAAFSINTAHWPYLKVLKNHFFFCSKS